MRSWQAIVSSWGSRESDATEYTCTQSLIFQTFPIPFFCFSQYPYVIPFVVVAQSRIFLYYLVIVLFAFWFLRILFFFFNWYSRDITDIVLCVRYIMCWIDTFIYCCIIIGWANKYHILSFLENAIRYSIARESKPCPLQRAHQDSSFLLAFFICSIWFFLRISTSLLTLFICSACSLLYPLESVLY